MPEHFSFDVFLSHSAMDKAVVRAVAERLRADGLRVWSDDGDVEEGLKQSRVLVLCLSANAFGEDWAQLESGTLRFRDPLNQDRRFIPLRLDDAPIKGSLAQFLFINWLPADREEEYPKLLEACRPLKVVLIPEPQPVREQLHEKIISLSHMGAIHRVTFSPDGNLVLSGAGDQTVRLWDVDTGRCLRVLEGHSYRVWSVAWSPDGCRAASGAADHTVRLWDVETGRCVRVLEGHSDGVLSVDWSPDGCRAVSGAADDTVRLWDVETGRCLRVLESHSAGVVSAAWSPDGGHAVSGAVDHTVRL
jgi:WD40 repeat protein